MLSKVQLFDASRCNGLKTMKDCVGCGMHKEADCVATVAATAIELKVENEELKLMLGVILESNRKGGSTINEKIVAKIKELIK